MCGMNLFTIARLIFHLNKGIIYEECGVGCLTVRPEGMTQNAKE